MSRADLESLRIYLENLKQKYIQPLENELERIESIAKGAQQAVSYEDYKSMISSLTVLSKDYYKVGQSIYIETVDVPDLWVSKLLDEFAPFMYVNDEQLVLELKENGHVDIGFFRLAQLENGKVNLPDYVKFTDIAGPNKPGLVTYNSTHGMQMIGSALAPLTWEVFVTNRTNAFMSYALLDKSVMQSLTNCKVPDIWTDEGKAKACETIGAATKAEIGDINAALEAILGV